MGNTKINLSLEVFQQQNVHFKHICKRLIMHLLSFAVHETKTSFVFRQKQTDKAKKRNHCHC